MHEELSRQRGRGGILECSYSLWCSVCKCGVCAVGLMAKMMQNGLGQHMYVHVTDKEKDCGKMKLIHG